MFWSQGADGGSVLDFMSLKTFPDVSLDILNPLCKFPVSLVVFVRSLSWVAQAVADKWFAQSSHRVLGSIPRQGRSKSLLCGVRVFTWCLSFLLTEVILYFPCAW